MIYLVSSEIVALNGGVKLDPWLLIRSNGAGGSEAVKVGRMSCCNIMRKNHIVHEVLSYQRALLQILSRRKLYICNP